jgi:hypothetical protein
MLLCLVPKLGLVLSVSLPIFVFIEVRDNMGFLELTAIPNIPQGLVYSAVSKKLISTVQKEFLHVCSHIEICYLLYRGKKRSAAIPLTGREGL